MGSQLLQLVMRRRQRVCHRSHQQRHRLELLATLMPPHWSDLR